VIEIVAYDPAWPERLRVEVVVDHLDPEPGPAQHRRHSERRDRQATGASAHERSSKSRPS
jgi:hypothetical protein